MPKIQREQPIASRKYSDFTLCSVIRNNSFVPILGLMSKSKMATNP
jgi:hypothetical protein